MVGVNKEKDFSSDPVAESKKRKPGEMKAKFKQAVYSVIVEYHQAYIDYYPDDPYSYERQGYALYAKGEYEQAVERLNQALSLGTVNSRLWKVLAQSCFNAFKKTQVWDFLTQARTAYDNAMKYLEVFTNPVVVYEYAFVQEKVGDYSGSLETIRKVNEVIYIPISSINSQTNS